MISQLVTFCVCCCDNNIPYLLWALVNSSVTIAIAFPEVSGGVWSNILWFFCFVGPFLSCFAPLLLPKLISNNRLPFAPPFSSCFVPSFSSVQCRRFRRSCAVVFIASCAADFIVSPCFHRVFSHRFHHRVLCRVFSVFLFHPAVEKNIPWVSFVFL